MVYDIPRSATAKTVFREDFGDNLGVQPYVGQHIGVNYSQLEGLFKINCTAKSDAFYYQPLNNSAVLPVRFQLSLSTRIVSGAKTGAIGLLFQYQDNDNYYVYLINNGGRVRGPGQIETESRRRSRIGSPPLASATVRPTLLTVKADGIDYTILLTTATRPIYG